MEKKVFRFKMVDLCQIVSSSTKGQTRPTKHGAILGLSGSLLDKASVDVKRCLLRHFILHCIAIR